MWSEALSVSVILEWRNWCAFMHCVICQVNASDQKQPSPFRMSHWKKQTKYSQNNLTKLNGFKKQFIFSHFFSLLFYMSIQAS